MCVGDVFSPLELEHKLTSMLATRDMRLLASAAQSKISRLQRATRSSFLHALGSKQRLEVKSTVSLTVPLTVVPVVVCCSACPWCCQWCWCCCWRRCDRAKINRQARPVRVDMLRGPSFFVLFSETFLVTVPSSTAPSLGSRFKVSGNTQVGLELDACRAKRERVGPWSLSFFLL